MKKKSSTNKDNIDSVEQKESAPEPESQIVFETMNTNDIAPKGSTMARLMLHAHHIGLFGK